MPDLFDPITFGDIECANRIIMAPMTRSRAGEGDAPTAMNAEYYGQRASAGLIITEGVYPNFDGKGYVRTPGIVTDEQIAGWKRVADAVHAKGGKIVMQIMHCGRVASKHNKPESARTLAPSAIQAKGEMYTDAAGMAPFETPEEMTLAEIKQTIKDYGDASRKAIEAGCDGVELHCASGYLPAQFLSTGTNTRDDDYGGSLENRLRFVQEVLDAMITAVGASRVGIRICPGNPFNDLSDENPEETFRDLIKAINPLDLAYLHVIRMKAGVDNIALAKGFEGPVILNDSYDLERGNRALDKADADAISFARHYISNPDLAEKFKAGAELTKPDYKTMYTPGPKGYTDYWTGNAHSIFCEWRQKKKEKLESLGFVVDLVDCDPTPNTAKRIDVSGNQIEATICVWESGAVEFDAARGKHGSTIFVDRAREDMNLIDKLNYYLDVIMGELDL